MNATHDRVDKHLLAQILKISDLFPSVLARAQFAKAARDLCKRMPTEMLPVHLFQLGESLCEHNYELARKVTGAIAKLFQAGVIHSDYAEAA